MHFGLSTRYYCHFTSPIRRYPDLQIHRIIKETLHNKFTTRRFSHYDAILPKVAEQSSKMERRAEEVEREVCKLKKAEYMRRRIGEVHEGIISGVTNWGIYVELPNTIEEWCMYPFFREITITMMRRLILWSVRELEEPLN